jgi:hypothetical protein
MPETPVATASWQVSIHIVGDRDALSALNLIMRDDFPILQQPRWLADEASRVPAAFVASRVPW